MSDRQGKGAFFDVDGTLVGSDIVRAFAYYALNQGTILGSLAKVAKTALNVPLYWATDKLSRKAFNDLFYLAYEGQSEDRLRELAEEMADKVLLPAVFPRTRELLRQVKADGCRVIFVTGALDFCVEPLAQKLGADAVIANKMQFTRGRATGRLQKPVVEGANKAAAIRAYCEQESLSLHASYGYSDSGSDYPMLAVVGHPTAVNPDLRLRILARNYDWPILDLT